MSEQIKSLPSQSPQIKLGVFLREHRLAKKTATTELARTLILSAAQITAIETGSQASFHNQSFYLRALKKYIAHMNLAMDPQASQLFAEIETELLSASTKINVNEVNLLVQTGLAHKRSSYLPQFRLKKTHFFWISLLVLVLVGLAAALLEGWPEKQITRQAELVSSPAPAPSPAQAPTLTPAPAKKIGAVPDATVSQDQKTAPIATPATAISPNAAISENAQPSMPQHSAPPPTTDNKTTTSTPEPKSTTLKLTFSAPSWVQVVEENGKRIEKVFTSADSLELNPANLASLVIGNARETKLFTNATEIDLTKYQNPGSGVARFNQSEIMKLGQ